MQKPAERHEIHGWFPEILEYKSRLKGIKYAVGDPKVLEYKGQLPEKYVAGGPNPITFQYC